MTGRRLRGLALPAVLWTLAALTLMLGALVRFARLETQLTATLLARQRAEAHLQAGITYALAAIEQDPRLAGQPPVITRVVLLEQAIDITIVNAAGLVDANYASDPLMAQLLQGALGWTPERVQAFLQTRAARQQPAYRTMLDLRRDTSFSDDDWRRLQPFITTYAGRSGVNLLLAPVDMLTLLRPDNPGAVATFDEARRRQPDLADLTLIGSPHHQTLPVRAFRIDVATVLPDGHRFARRYWVAQPRLPPYRLDVVESEELPTS